MIHVVIGAPCSGKSTYVNEHAKEGEIKVDFDRIADSLGNSDPHEAKGHIKDCSFTVRNAAINYLIEHSDADGWVIHTKPTEEQMEVYKAAGAVFVELETDMATCLERARNDKRLQRSIDGIYAYFGKGESNMNIKRKTYEVKAENGMISGYASTWTREPDSYGDVVAKGAFSECLEHIKEEGRVLPLLWNHDSYELKYYIGTVVSLEEDDHGLKFEATFDDTPEAQRARELAMDGRLAKFSFAYDVVDQGEVDLEDGRKANELRKLNIHEVSLVMYPANDDTSVIEVKAGRRNSAKDEDKLRQIIALAEDILGELDDTQPEEDSEVKSEELDTVNDEEQKRLDGLKAEAERLLKGE